MRCQGSGQALVEYVVLLALASLVAIGTVTIAGNQLAAAYQQVSALLANPAAAIISTASATPTPTGPAASIASPASTPTPVATPEPTPGATPPSPVPTPAVRETPAAETDRGRNGGDHTGEDSNINAQR